MAKEIPLQNIVKQNAQLRDELINNFVSVLDSGRYVSGPGVEKFEQEFAKYLSVEYAIGLSSGSSALELALKSVGVEKGDEVIVPSLTFIASIEAILEADAIPVLIDIDPLTWNIDPKLIEKAITPKTKAIVPVHLHGRLADMNKILPVAQKNNLKVVEDSAQAHGASRGEFRAGSCSDAAAFSFYPGKNLGALGEAGAVSTDNQSVYEFIKRARNYGSKEKYVHIHRGNNFRMDELQSLLLSTKLKHLDEWTEKRIKSAKQYDKNLDGKAIVRTHSDEGRHVYHIYSVLVDNRNKVMADMGSKKIGVSSHYPIPCHLQEGYKNFIKIGSNLDNSELISSKLLSLPLDENITPEDIAYICVELEKSIKKHG
jgi:dTDP-4-amino-4,6-dideoxygalactose transaminase